MMIPDPLERIKMHFVEGTIFVRVSHSELTLFKYGILNKKKIKDIKYWPTDLAHSYSVLRH